MKGLFVSVILTAAIMYGQFSSGIDYSVKENREKDLAGAGFIVETGNAEWKLNYGSGESFTAKSELFGGGYEVFAENHFTDFGIDIQAKHIFKSLKNSASIDSSGSLTNLDTEDISSQMFDIGTGIKYKDTYGISAKYILYSSSDVNNASFFGVGADYVLNISDNKHFDFFYEMKLSGDKEDLSNYIFISESEPGMRSGFRYSVVSEAYEWSVYMNYSSYDGDIFKYLDSDYIDSGISYKYVFTNVGSSISLSAGSNFSSGFDFPEIRLPFFYYTLEYENTLAKDKFELIVGWNYEMFSSDLRYRSEFAGIIPETINSDEIKETSASSRLYVKLNFRY